MATLADILRQTGYAQDGKLATPAPIESPMTKVLADHIASLPQKFEQNQQNQMNLLSQAFPGNTYESMMTQGDPKALAELGMQVPFNAMIAYHGTPHNILGKFDISKVGTGEGAQAYGHGMYFAESPEVAKTYMPKFEEKQIENAIFAANGDVNKAIQKAQLESISIAGNKNVPLSTKQEVFNLVDGLKKIKAGEPLTQGNLYKVDIPDEYIPNMLDWDKPLLEQTPEVQKALANLGIKTDKQKLKAFDDALLDALMNDASKELPKQPINPTGADIYQRFVQGNPQLTSQKLNEAGIRGIRYLDQGSRTGGGTSNFVVFDPSEVKILEKNSKPVSRKELLEQQVNKLKD